MSFVMLKASDKSINMRKPLYGVGINDSWYVISKKTEGKLILCPIYRVWANMITRCYSDQYQKKHPTYEDCTVCDEWLLFSCFYKWAVNRYIIGYDLDKDIKLPDNKIYSPMACIFVSKEVNYLVLGKRKNSKYKQGVSWCTRDNTFVAFMSVKGKSKYLGSFKTEEEASVRYLKEKQKRIMCVAKDQTDISVKEALINYAKLLCSGHTD